MTVSDAAGSARFGFSVSLSGDTAVVGAKGDSCEAGTDCGSAYVFRLHGDTWVEEQKLIASDAAEFDSLGYSVFIRGDTIVVGAHSDDCAAGISCGAAYVFSFDGTTWVEEQKLTASDAAYNDHFGITVSVFGDTAVVGAIFDAGPGGSLCGAAYVFRFDGTTWVEEQKLTASDAEAADLFATSLFLSGDTAVVGAVRTTCPAGISCGSAYVFDVSAVCGDGLILGGEDCDPPDGRCCSDTCTFEAAGTACPDDGNDCTADECDGAGACDHPNLAAGTACDDGEECTLEDQCPGEPDNDCAGEYQVQVYADICLPYYPPSTPMPNLDDILCELDDFADGSEVDGCTCDGFRNTTDLHPCPEDGGGDGEIGLDDVIKMLDAFGGLSPCDDPCP